VFTQATNGINGSGGGGTDPFGSNLNQAGSGGPGIVIVRYPIQRL
jgi:hypothetical protein